MQEQIDDLKVDLKDFRGDVDRRFEQVDKRFDAAKADMEKRFDAAKADMDKRVEQVDRRFDQIIASIDRLGDKLEHRDEKQRGFTLRMFTIAISISVIGVLGAFLKSLGVF